MNYSYLLFYLSRLLGLIFAIPAWHGHRRSGLDSRSNDLMLNHLNLWMRFYPLTDWVGRNHVTSCDYDQSVGIPPVFCSRQLPLQPWPSQGATADGGIASQSWCFFLWLPKLGEAKFGCLDLGCNDDISKISNICNMYPTCVFEASVLTHIQKTLAPQLRWALNCVGIWSCSVAVVYSRANGCFYMSQLLDSHPTSRGIGKVSQSSICDQ